MSLLAIKAALETRLKSIASPLATQWENAPFTPPDKAPYQRVDFLPAPPENPTMGDLFHRDLGLMQVTLLYPLSGGAGAAVSRAEQIRAWFSRGMSFSANGVVVTIPRTVEIAPGRTVGDRYAVPVLVRYFANILS